MSPRLKCTFLVYPRSPRLTEEYEAVPASSVPALERFLHTFRNVLGDGHYLALSAKHSLSQLYGKVEQYVFG